MAARVTIERILRDPDDASGQTIREWKIESEPGRITIQMKRGFIGLQPDDVDMLVLDLKRAEEMARRLAAEDASDGEGATSEEKR